MDGKVFILNLQKLGVPKLEENCFDYLFLDYKNKPLVKFWEWFFENTSLHDKLSDEQLAEYDDLIKNDNILSGTQIEREEVNLEPFLSHLEHATNSNEEIQNDEQLESLEEKIKMLIRKKEQLSLHNFEAKEKLKEENNKVENLKKELEKIKKLSIEKSSVVHSKSLENLVSSVDRTAAYFVLFDKENEKPDYFSQLPMLEWQKKEEEFSSSIETYVERQFKEGIETIAGQKDHSIYCIIDSGQIESQLVRGSSEQVKRCVKELNRISCMLEYCEVDSLINYINKTKAQVQMDEALKIVKLKKEHLPLTSVDFEEKVNILEQDLSRQLNYLSTHASKVAQLERLKVISGNYEVKLQRQQYYLTKQHNVINFLVDQLSRHDLLKIILGIEKTRILAILQILVKLNKYISVNHSKFTLRMQALTNLSDKLKRGNNTPEIFPMMKLLDGNFQNQDSNSIEASSQPLKRLALSIKSSDGELFTLVKKQKQLLHKICKMCVVLEECLFKKSSSLLVSWISNSLFNRTEALDQKVFTLYQSMLKLIQEYEKKKKMLESNFDTVEDLNTT